MEYKIGEDRVTTVKGTSDGIRAEGYRMIGAHAFSTNDRGRGDEKPEQIGYLDDNKVVWHRPYSDVFDKG